MLGDTTRYQIRPFEQYAGEVNYGSQHPERSSVLLTAEARSVTCNDAWAKKKERRKKIVDAAVNDMMAATQYPQLPFISTRISAKPHSSMLDSLAQRTK